MFHGEADTHPWWICIFTATIDIRARYGIASADFDPYGLREPLNIRNVV